MTRSWCATRLPDNSLVVKKCSILRNQALALQILGMLRCFGHTNRPQLIRLRFLYQRALIRTICQFSTSGGHDLPALVDAFIPGLATERDNLIIGSEYPT